MSEVSGEGRERVRGPQRRVVLAKGQEEGPKVLL